MALLTEPEVRELVQTDIGTAGLQRLIDSAEAAIIERHGPTYPTPILRSMQRFDMSLMPSNFMYLDRPISPVGASAQLITALAGLNNDLQFISLLPGAAGNTVSITYVVAGLNTVLSVSVSGRAITVHVATDGAGVAVSTAAQVLAALVGSAPASALILGALAVGNDGTGVVTALGITFLAGGVGGIVSITEYFGNELQSSVVVLSENDWRLHFNGNAIERIGDGTNQRWVWGHRVDLVYVPVDDTLKRREVLTELVRLAIRHTGVQGESVGNESTTSYASYTNERQELLSSLGSVIAFS